LRTSHRSRTSKKKGRKKYFEKSLLHVPESEVLILCLFLSQKGDLSTSSKRMSLKMGRSSSNGRAVVAKMMLSSFILDQMGYSKGLTTKSGPEKGIYRCHVYFPLLEALHQLSLFQPGPLPC
jgi:hypothetical protein